MMRKRGKKINNTLTIKPLGMKSDRFEFAARASLVALQSDIATQDHLVNFYVLADLVQRIGGAQHAITHADTIKRLCDEIHMSAIIGHPCEKYGCSILQYEAMRASVDVLVKHIHQQKNSDIARHALAAIGEMERRAA